MSTYEIEQTRIKFVQAHAMMYELMFSLSDDERYAKTADKLFAIVPGLRDFVASVLGKSSEECVDMTTDLILDSQKLKRFFNEHFSRIAS